MSHRSLVPSARGFDAHLGYLAGSEDHFTHQGGSIACKAAAAAAATKHRDAVGRGGTPLYDMYGTGAPVLDVAQRFGGVYNGLIFTELAVAAIANHSASTAGAGAAPLFLYLAFANCHHPMQVPDRWLSLYPDVKDAKRQTYQAMTSFVDEALLNVTNELKRAGMWQNTLLVVASDNGGPSLTDLDTSNNFPLRGGKYSLFEGGMRVTAFASGGYLPAARRGTTVGALAHVADLYATYAHAAGAPIADLDPAAAGLPPVDGVSLLATLRGGDGGAPPPPRVELALSLRWGDDGCSDATHAPPYASHGSGALIVWPLKLIVGVTCPAHWTGPNSPNASTPIPPSGLRHDCGRAGCLFHLVHDPTEHQDLVASGAAGKNATLGRLLAAMQARMAAVNATVYQTPYDASELTPAECSSPGVVAMLKGGVWAPWEPAAAPRS